MVHIALISLTSALLLAPSTVLGAPVALNGALDRREPFLPFLPAAKINDVANAIDHRDITSSFDSREPEPFLPFLRPAQITEVANAINQREFDDEDFLLARDEFELEEVVARDEFDDDLLARDEFELEEVLARDDELEERGLFSMIKNAFSGKKNKDKDQECEDKEEKPKGFFGRIKSFFSGKKKCKHTKDGQEKPKKKGFFSRLKEMFTKKKEKKEKPKKETTEDSTESETDKRSESSQLYARDTDFVLERRFLDGILSGLRRVFGFKDHETTAQKKAKDAKKQAEQHKERLHLIKEKLYRQHEKLSKSRTDAKANLKKIKTELTKVAKQQTSGPQNAGEKAAAPVPPQPAPVAAVATTQTSTSSTPPPPPVKAAEGETVQTVLNGVPVAQPKAEAAAKPDGESAAAAPATPEE